MIQISELFVVVGALNDSSHVAELWVLDRLDDGVNIHLPLEVNLLGRPQAQHRVYILDHFKN